MELHRPVDRDAVLTRHHPEHAERRGADRPGVDGVGLHQQLDLAALRPGRRHAPFRDVHRLAATGCEVARREDPPRDGAFRMVFRRGEYTEVSGYTGRCAGAAGNLFPQFAGQYRRRVRDDRFPGNQYLEIYRLFEPNL